MTYLSSAQAWWSFFVAFALGVGAILDPVDANAQCQNVPLGYVVAATRHQNVGGIEPTNLVVLGTRVRLFA